MINELVNSIIEAEAKAEEIVRGGAERSAEVLSVAEAEVTEMRRSSEDAMRREGEALSAEYSSAADAACAEILAGGRAEAERIKRDSADEAEKISDEVVRWIVSGNC